MVDEGFIERWVAELRREFPDAVAVILKGSYARGEPTPFSDVDFDLLTAGEPREDYPVYFDRTAGGRLAHVSVAVRDLDGWLAATDEPQPWAFGLAAERAARLLWAADDAINQRLNQPYQRHPPTKPELEDFVTDLGKVLHAYHARDELAVRLAAHSLARLCPSVLRPLNPETLAGTHLEALHLAMSLPTAPPGYRSDMLICLGLTGQATSADDIVAAATRLVVGTLDLLHPHADRIAADLPRGLDRALADGTLRRYVAQLMGTKR